MACYEELESWLCPYSDLKNADEDGHGRDTKGRIRLIDMLSAAVSELRVDRMGGESMRLVILYFFSFQFLCEVFINGLGSVMLPTYSCMLALGIFGLDSIYFLRCCDDTNHTIRMVLLS